MGLTGLLYIDLQQNPDTTGTKALRQGTQHPVIPSRKSSIEASIERLPEILGQAMEVLSRIEHVLSDENVRSIGQTLAHVEQASEALPETMADARALATDLRGISSSTLELTNRLNRTLGKVQPDLEATLANARIASDSLARTADSLDRLLNQNEGGLGKAASASVAELQQLVIDARSASNEVRELARTYGSGRRVFCSSRRRPAWRFRDDDCNGQGSLRPAPWLACAASLALLLGGCGNARPMPRHPILSASVFATTIVAPAASATSVPAGLAIAVARPRAAAAIDTDRIAVHSAGNRFDYYSAARWAESARRRRSINSAQRAGGHGSVRRGRHDSPSSRADGTPARRGTATIRSGRCGRRMPHPRGAAPVVHVQVQASLVDSRRAARVTSFVSEAVRARVGESVECGRRGVRSRECTGRERHRCTRAGCGGGIAGEIATRPRPSHAVCHRQAEVAVPLAGTWLIACSLIAVMVSDGLTPGLAGTVEPSQTRKFR